MEHLALLSLSYAKVNHDRYSSALSRFPRPSDSPEKPVPLLHDALGTAYVSFYSASAMSTRLLFSDMDMSHSETDMDLRAIRSFLLLIMDYFNTA